MISFGPHQHMIAAYLQKKQAHVPSSSNNGTAVNHTRQYFN
jgi:hypothetical protein